jgi:hypothetical protein
MFGLFTRYLLDQRTGDRPPVFKTTTAMARARFALGTVRARVLTHPARKSFPLERL